MKAPIERLMIVVMSAACARGAVLDFESVNGTVPIEGMSISNQFKAHFGMSFRREDGGVPVIGKRGAPRSSFIVNSVDPPIYDTLHPDDPQAGLVGEFFLTDDGVVGGTKRIIIDFAEPVSMASGYVFDIDAQERMTVIAYSDDGTTELERVVLEAGEGGTGEGRSSLWKFTRAAKDIRQIRLRETGPSNDANMGFDNFDSDFVPLPATAPLYNLHLYAGLTIVGDVGRPYRIESTERLEGNALAAADWRPVTNVFLPTSPFLFLDLTSTNSAVKFYRAVAIE